MSASNEKARKKPSVAELLASKTTLPSDLLIGEFRLEVRGRNTVIINGCKRILEYSPERMRLAIKKSSVCVSGERLICSTYHDGAICIEGYIGSISFDDGEESEV